MSLRNRATPARSARAFAALTLAALGACTTLRAVGGGTPASLPTRAPARGPGHGDGLAPARVPRGPRRWSATA
jgi:hypothetical protein